MDSTKIVAWWGAVLSTVGIVLSILNYLLAKRNQEENTAERILVSLEPSVAHEFSPTPNGDLVMEAKGELVMEVVNIGLRPLFIKRADMQIGRQIVSFYEHDRTKTNQPMKSLEPSEAIRYRIKNFTEVVLQRTGQRETQLWMVPHRRPVSKTQEQAESPQLQDVEVRVETTKKTFSLQLKVQNFVSVFTYD